MWGNWHKIRSNIHQSISKGCHGNREIISRQYMWGVNLNAHINQDHLFFFCLNGTSSDLLLSSIRRCMLPFNSFLLLLFSGSTLYTNAIETTRAIPRWVLTVQYGNRPQKKETTNMAFVLTISHTHTHSTHAVCFIDGCFIG